MITLHKTVQFLGLKFSQEQLSKLGHQIVAFAKEKEIRYQKVDETQGGRTYKVNAYPQFMRDDIQLIVKQFAEENGIRVKRKRARIKRIEKV